MARQADARAESAAPLDLHEGIVPLEEEAGGRIADPQAEKCRRWPEHLVLANVSTETFVQGRCRATNLCRHCQKLYVLETMEMLSLDATEYAPTIWAVLTAREHLTRADTRRHLEHLRRAARKRWPAIEWFVQVEFQRRGALHLNLIVKGVPDADVEALGGLLTRAWCSRVDALPIGQWIGRIEDPEGTVRYLQKTLAHGLKREQAPPIGWRGHRTSQTRGYLVRPASVMREEARRSLRLKRIQHSGFELGDALIERHVQEQHVWKLSRHPDRKAGDVSGDVLRGERLPPPINRAAEERTRACADVNPAQRAIAPPPPARASLPGRRAGRAEGPLPGLTSEHAGAPLPARLFVAPAVHRRRRLRPNWSPP